jgi:glucosamine--fructose-6-phosphate aminotransferase (isomerizing)
MADILDQPRALRAALAAAAPPRAPAGPIVLAGMGASYFAAYPSFLRLLGSGRPAAWIEAGELLHEAQGALRPGATLVLVSQSGRSAEVVRLLENPRGACVIGLTNDAQSPLARRADVHLAMHAGQEQAGVATKTFTCSLLALDLLAGGDPTRWPAVIAQVETVLEGRGRWLPPLVETLGGAPHIWVLARGPALAAALGGALMLKEAGAVHAEGMSVPQFRHGPLEAAGPGRAALVFVSPGALGRLDLDLAAEMAAAGMAVAAICPPGEVGDASGVCRLEWAGSAEPACLAAGCQLLAHAFALRRGIVPGTFARVGKVTTRE